MRAKPTPFTPGRRYGMLRAIWEKRLPKTVTGKGRVAHWLCVCDCGGPAVWRRKDHLLAGRTTHCGCLSRIARTETGRILSAPTHGLVGHSLYPTWQQMVYRCTNPDSKHWASYGGRGITVCDRWKDDPQAFIDDMGPKPTPVHSVGRIDNDGPYAPWNCRWETPYEQANNRRDNRWVLWEGVRMTLAQASRASRKTLYWCERNLQAAA